jgi:hypothetical protein
VKVLRGEPFVNCCARRRPASEMRHGVRGVHHFIKMQHWTKVLRGRRLLVRRQERVAAVHELAPFGLFTNRLLRRSRDETKLESRASNDSTTVTVASRSASIRKARIARRIRRLAPGSPQPSKGSNLVAHDFSTDRPTAVSDFAHARRTSRELRTTTFGSEYWCLSSLTTCSTRLRSARKSED